jgi:triosephosphate isomerase
MNKTRTEAEKLVQDLLYDLKSDFKDVDIVLCPPFTAIAKCVEILGNHSRIMVGAQNLHEKPHGAFTGEISASMLRDLYCRYVIIGHSERRQFFGETDKLVNEKAKAAFSCNLLPIICVGEKLAEREADKTEDVILTQVKGSFDGFSKEEWNNTTIAYEPVWAIGTGKNATPEQAQEVHELIREQVEKMAGKNVASKIRILYGGSVKSENSLDLIKQPDVDGFLVGGASLDARSFANIIRNSVNV